MVLQKGSAYFDLKQLQFAYSLKQGCGCMSDYAISWSSLGDAEYFPTATDLFFHLRSLVLLTSCLWLACRKPSSLGKGKEENKRCFGHFTNETKTNKKAKERNRPGKQLVYAKAGIHSEILSVSGTFAV